MSRNPDVVSVIIHHHAQLQDSLTIRVDAVLSAARTAAPYDGPLAELRNLLAHDIVPHARAEEEVLYAAAVAEILRPLVAGMIFEHETILDLANLLDGVTTVADAAAIAFAIQAVFVGHIRRENELLLPALAADPSIDLPELLPIMERRFVTHQAAAEV